MALPKPEKSPYDVVVLGAGVLGLATADALSATGLRVAILARDLPEDVDSAAFASPWAGANWSSFGNNESERRRDTFTFEEFGRLAKSHPEIVTRRQFKYIWNKDKGYSSPWYKDVVFNFRPLERSEVPGPYSEGVSFESYTLNPHKYNALLASRLRDRGVPIVRKRVSSLDEAFAHFGPVDYVVNATGLGAKSLLGVEDPAVFPDRGQTALVRAPKVDICFGVRDANMAEGKAVYVIPRPGSGGCVIVGGTNIKGEYSTLPRREMAESILQNAFEICPELANGGTSWKDIEVVSHNVGLRPAREGGLRLEIEERMIQPDALVPEGGKSKSRPVTVLHCYGIGPAGYQANLGIAEEAKEITLKYLNKQRSRL
ncbi:hypothetical protein CspHIS471_0109400 [Cutaneotrichosporon sp. HIS471]|nr:hypothetical protein CspHIS471_0109400 [Cutaneotrichosporon sp. HIS471]